MCFICPVATHLYDVYSKLKNSNIDGSNFSLEKNALYDIAVNNQKLCYN